MRSIKLNEEKYRILLECMQCAVDVNWGGDGVEEGFEEKAANLLYELKKLDFKEADKDE